MINIRGIKSKKAALWTLAFGILGLTSYPIIFRPMLYSAEYREIQKITREGIDQEKVQPGNMRVWRNPFKT